MLSNGPESEDVSLQDESQRKLQAKRLMSDQQKANELTLLKEALRRAEQQQMKEEAQQIKMVIHEMKKTKRNKSQEPAGKGDPDKNDAGASSHGSLEVVADDEDDEERLREVIEVEGELNFENLAAKGEEEKCTLPLPRGKIIEAQKQ